MEMGGGETVIMHSHSAIVHYLTPNTGTLDLDGGFSHPKSVMRGFAEVDKVESGKPNQYHRSGNFHVMKLSYGKFCFENFS